MLPMDMNNENRVTNALEDPTQVTNLLAEELKSFKTQMDEELQEITHRLDLLDSMIKNRLEAQNEGSDLPSKFTPLELEVESVKKNEGCDTGLTGLDTQRDITEEMSTATEGEMQIKHAVTAESTFESEVIKTGVYILCPRRSNWSYKQWTGGHESHEW